MVIQGEVKKYYVPKKWLVGGQFGLLRDGAYSRCISVLLNIRCFMLNIQIELMIYV